MSDTALSDIDSAPEQGAQVDPAVEAKARETGWVPKDEYKGDPTKWKPADKWKSPDEQIGAIRKRAESLEKKLTRQGEDFADKIKRMERMNALAIKAARQEIIDKYEQKKREAVKIGDEEAYDRADTAKAKALKLLDDEAEEAKPAEKADAEDEFSPEEVEAVEDWKDENEWFGDDADMTKFANNKFVRIGRREPDMTIKDRLAEVRRAVEERFPDKFSPRKGNGASRVEGGGRDMGGGGGRSAFAGLPAEVRAQADRFIDEGLFLEKGETKDKNRVQARERYAREYLKDGK